jgi:Cell shape-determining protein
MKLINSNYKYFLMIILAFLIDSILSYFLPYDFTKQSLMLVPSIGVLVFVLIMLRIKEKHYSYAVLTGFYYGLFYGNALPIYMIIYVMIVFMVKIISKFYLSSWLEALTLFVSTIFIYHLSIYLLMYITKMTSLKIIDYILRRFLPSLLLNIVLGMIIYFIFKLCHKNEEWGGYHEYTS